MAIFSSKPLLTDSETEFVTTLKAYLNAQQGALLDLSTINELARASNCWDFAYYGIQGFSEADKKAVNHALLRDDSSLLLKEISDKQWAEELSVKTAAKSLLNSLVSSKERYLNLYIKPTGLLLNRQQANKFLPETAVYKKDKKTGAFALETLDQLLFSAYRLDLAQHNDLEELNRKPNQMVPPSLLFPLSELVSRIAADEITDLDLQYIFTWLLQYAATITAVSTLYASYNTAALPAEVTEQTSSILEKLVQEVSTVDLTKMTGVKDPLALSQQLLKQIPVLYEDANNKMTALNQQLLPPDPLTGEARISSRPELK